MAEGKKTSKRDSYRKVHLSYKAKEYVAANLALLLRAAVPIGEALESLAATAPNAAFRKALMHMQEDIDAGYSLADALERSGVATGQTLALVRLGEASGRLVDNLELAAQQEEKRRLLRAKVRSALIYPSFVLGLTVVVGLGVAWFLLPKLAATFTQLNVALPFISRITIDFGLFLRENGAVVLPVFFGVLFLVGYIIFAAPRTKFIGQAILFRLPGMGRLLREVEVAQFGYLLGTLLNAGLPVTQALQLLSQTSSTARYQKFYRFLAASLDEGYAFKGSIARYRGSNRLLPGSVQQIVSAGERSGSLPDVLLTVGRTYEQKADVTTSNLEAIIEPVLLVVVWVGVMIVAVAVILPIYSLVGGLQ